jgi:predicted enzyme related to lactoylglutathione lyase
MQNNMPEATTPAVHLEHIGQIAITVRDLACSKDFYQNVLGMKLLFDAGRMTFFQCGAVRLMIGASEPEASFSPGATILYFKVEDIHAAHTALQTQGVAFSHAPHLVARMRDQDLWMAFLKDPDGNALALMSEVPSR